MSDDLDALDAMVFELRHCVARAAFFDWPALKNLPRPADEAEMAELRHMLDRGEIRAGLTFPSVDARVSARMAGEYFGLLGWV